MVWSWRFLQDMGIWCECIKWVQKPNKKWKSPFTDLDFPNCTYTYSKIYLGSKAKVCLCDKKIEFNFSFSVRDGILVKINCNQPYRVLFHYVDGSYYINDDSNIDYKRLIESLSVIRNDTFMHHQREIYAKLEETMFDFIAVSFL